MADTSKVDTCKESEAGVAGIEFDVGQRLLFLRKQLGLSQRELARRAGMTNGNLSLIEQGKISPSIQSLEKVLKAIPVSIAEFFALQPAPTAPVIRADDFLHIRKNGAEYWVHQLSMSGQSELSIAREIIPPGAAATCEWMHHGGKVAGIVISGVLCLHLDGLQYIVNAGEGYQFSLSRACRYQNTGDEPLLMFSVLSS